MLMVAAIPHVQARASWNGQFVDYHRGTQMTISRENVDRRAVDFSDVTSGRRLPPVHPGRFLRDEFLAPLGISVYALAKALMSPGRGSTTWCEVGAP